MIIFGFYDKKVRSYVQVMVVEHPELIVRYIKQLPTDHPYINYAEDFSVYSLGTMNTETGTIDQASDPRTGGGETYPAFLLDVATLVAVKKDG